MSEGIEDLLRHPGIWRPGDAAALPASVVPSGFPALDALLPGRGWPGGAISEIHAVREGVGELGLLLPVLGALCSAGRWIVFVAPPYVPYAPAFGQRGIALSRLLLVRAEERHENLWAAEQALRVPACGAVVLWEGARRLDTKSLRRLQLAAEDGGGLVVVFRHPRSGTSPSPAKLRLRAEPDSAGLAVTLIKGRGAVPGKRVLLGEEAFRITSQEAPCPRQHR